MHSQKQCKVHLRDTICRIQLSFWRMEMFERDIIVVYESMKMANFEKRHLYACTVNYIQQPDNCIRQIVSCRSALILKYNI